jgi:hypothetical protein
MTIEYQRNANGDFVCQHCGKIVPKEKQNTMHYHLKKHLNEVPHMCNTCGKCFPFKQQLLIHIHARHGHNDETTEIFECPVQGCAFRAHTWANRRIHYLRKHCINEISDIKEGNTCKVCTKTFNSSTAFFYHVGACLDGTNIPFFQGIV